MPLPIVENHEHADPYSRYNTHRARVVAEIAERLIELAEVESIARVALLLNSLSCISMRSMDALRWSLIILSGDQTIISKTYQEIANSRSDTGVSRQAIHQELTRVRDALEKFSPAVGAAFNEIELSRKRKVMNKGISLCDGSDAG